MRIWSIHPEHLDRQGLVACWRETLLAQAVLAGRTKGYQHHPQLARFRAAAAPDLPDRPLELVGAYLAHLADEADRRGYRFDRTRILRPGAHEGALRVTGGQLEYEWAHLLGKLEARSPQVWERWRSTAPRPHPVFAIVPGPIEEWERP